MRRKDKQVRSRAEIDAIIAGCQVCHLGLSLNDKPYVVPVCFGYDGTFLYFHTADSGKKIDYLQANPRVCFQMERGVKFAACGVAPCDWTFRFESVIGSGRVEALSDADATVRALGWIIRQYVGFDGGRLPVPTGMTAWRVVIEEICAKRS